VTNLLLDLTGVVALLSNYIETIVTAVIGAVIAAGSWLVRKVLTSERKIELLEAEIKGREERREEERKFLTQIQNQMQSGFDTLKRDVDEVRRDVLDIYKDR